MVGLRQGGLCECNSRVFNLRGDVFSRPLHLYAFPADEYKADGGIGPVGGYNIGLNPTMSRRKLTDNLFDLFDVRQFCTTSKRS